jgi:3-hydroxyisobutyrate dehydrogenase-like beta-hydroxyacid dehydrogenase
LKLAINGMVGATAALLAEALAFAGKGGVAPAAALEVIGQSAVASPVIGYKRDMIVRGDYAPNFTVEQMMKDFDILLSVGRAVHSPLPLAAQIRQQYEAAWLNGQAQKDFFVLVKELAELAGVKK